MGFPSGFFLSVFVLREPLVTGCGLRAVALCDCADGVRGCTLFAFVLAGVVARFGVVVSVLLMWWWVGSQKKAPAPWRKMRGGPGNRW